MPKTNPIFSDYTTMTLYESILKAKAQSKKLLAVLLDPDKIVLKDLPHLVKKINQSPASHIFVGGSEVRKPILQNVVPFLKSNTSLPVILFPGHPSQITPFADGILLLNLLSGNNPDFLAKYQIEAAPILQKTNLEILPTAYLLIDGGTPSAVERVSKTKPLSPLQPEKIYHTALAGQMMGNQLLYLEAGSGAAYPVAEDILKIVAKNTSIPLIVGGGISNQAAMQNAFRAGADLVVIGTAFEKDDTFFDTFNPLTTQI